MDTLSELSRLFPAFAFKNRSSVTVVEFAQLFRITKQQGHDLIEEGSLAAIDISSGVRAAKRRHWRIPISEVLRFASDRSNLGTRPTEAESGHFPASQPVAGALPPTAPRAGLAMPCNAVCNAPARRKGSA